MRPSLELLTEFTLDVWLMARFAPQLEGARFDGRTWERAVAGLLYRPGFTRRQGPGNHTFFGSASASGVDHELDGVAEGWRGSVIVECKATEWGISKADVALFHMKAMDFYQRKIAMVSREKWWCILCGTAPTTPAVRATAISLGMLICDIDRIPLPVLVRAAGRPAADMHLPEPLLQEVVRLGERAMRPLQDRWRYDANSGHLSTRPEHWKDSEIKDLLWLEDELTACLLDLHTTHRPGVLEQRAQKLLWCARKIA